MSPALFLPWKIDNEQPMNLNESWKGYIGKDCRKQSASRRLCRAQHIRLFCLKRTHAVLAGTSQPLPRAVGFQQNIRKALA